MMNPVLSRCLRFEFEDQIAELDRCEILSPIHEQVRNPTLRWIADRLDSTLRAPRLFSPPLERRYSLLFYLMQSFPDLYPLVPWSRLHSAADVSACYIDELWTHEIPKNSGAMDLLRRFDVIFVSFEGSVEALAHATHRPCYFVPPSVDALALCPFPRPPARVIDFYAMGRRPPQTHAALLRRAQRGDWFYHYDTFENARFTDHREHRQRLAGLIQRTRYFLVNTATCNEPSRTRGQRELGYRYFEGAAAGTVLIGDAPRTNSFDTLFGWPDAVIPLPFDSVDIAPILDALDADPQRVERIRRANIVNSLRKHDHVYRWAEVLKAVGLPETDMMQQRRRALEELAAEVELSAAMPTGTAGYIGPTGVVATSPATNSNAAAAAGPITSTRPGV